MNYIQPTLDEVTNENYDETIEGHINRGWPSISDGASIIEVSEMLANSPFCGFPVVNEDHFLIGFITERECLKYTLSEKYYHEPSTMVGHYMNKNVTLFSPEMNLLKALAQFVEHPYHVFPVVDHNGKYVGCTSRKELLRVALRLKEASWQ